ncbi:hypothetical protein [Massilia pseudoviolaceinigra]|uniref:hypothetical protein n=1 Tax=Massilia pseudoviolaceinigra TaxID=3057165 RepID=UPI002796C1FF|nr:hypothetical protein [Massilia sp. CCM 9206]MDQ1922468.1 hypothetical protein [Massilia sp. CCM 9206]
MQNLNTSTAIATPERPTHEELWLLGQAPLQKYLDFADDLCAESPEAIRPALIREWGAANLYYEELARTEAGVADHLDCAALPAAMMPLAAQVCASSQYRRTFNSLPTRIAMVELGRMVVCQNHVTRSFVDELKAQLGPHPDPQALFRFCFPPDEVRAPVHIREAGSKRFVFRSESTDFRFHEPVLLRPDQLNDYRASGTVAGVVGLVVGYSANILNAVCDDDSGRLVLNNGYHRTCALLELGITHAPCVIQTVSSRDELDLVAKSIVATDPGYFFNAPRPPLMRDFADPRIRKVLRIKKISRMIEVSYDVRDYFIEE